MISKLPALPGAWTLRRAATWATAVSLVGTVLLFSQRYLHCFPAPKLFAQTVPLGFAVAGALAAGTGPFMHIPRIPLLAVILWNAVSFTRSQSTEAFAVSFIPILSAAAMMWLAALLGSHRAERQRLWIAFVLAHLGCALYGILQYSGLDPLTWSVDYGTGRAFSTIGNPNFLGGQMALAIPVLLSLIVIQSGWLRMLAQLTLLAGFLAFVMAQTRGAMIGLAFGLGLGLVLFCIRRRRLPRWRGFLLWPGIGIVLAVFFFSVPALNRTGISLPIQISSSLDLEQASAWQRFFWWRGAAELFRAHPLAGTGLANFPREFPRAARNIIPYFSNLPPAFCDHPHNDYLFILCEQGIIGLGLMLWLAAAVARHLLALPAGRRAILALGISAGLAALAVHAIWNMPFVIPSTLLSAGLLAGLACSLPSPACSRFSKSPHFSPNRRFVLGGIALLATLALGLRPGVILIAQHYLNGARLMKEKQAYGPAAYLVRRSLKLTWAPWRQHFMLGGIFYGQHYYGESLKAFQRDEAENPWGADAILHQGKALRQMGKYDEAEVECRRALKLVPNYAGAAVTIAALDYFRAQDAREHGDNQGMRDYLRRADIWLTYALRFFPSDAEAHKLRGYVAVMAHDWDRALSAWGIYSDLRPDDDAVRRRVAALAADLPRLRAGRVDSLWTRPANGQEE